MSIDFLLGLFSTQLGMWWIIWPAILLGIVVGVLPGFSPQNTLIMLLPLTLALPVEQAFAFMVSMYCATHLAGGIPAILVKIPGTGGAAATTLDGYPMTQKGKAQQALVLCFMASVFGGLITTLVTIALLPYLSQVGLYLRIGRDGRRDAVRPDVDRRGGGQGRAQGIDRRLVRPADRRDRHRPHLQLAPRDLRLPRALRRRAAGAGADRPVCDLRSADHDREQDDRAPRKDAHARRALIGRTRSKGCASRSPTGGTSSGPRSSGCSSASCRAPAPASRPSSPTSSRACGRRHPSSTAPGIRRA